VHAGSATAAASPLLVGRSGEAHVTAIHVDFGSLRRVARSHGLTVNDVFLAALLDGVGRYHAKHGSVAPALRLGIPISARRTGTGMHNQLVGAVLRGPLGDLDFVERARLVHEIVVQGRSQPWAPLIEETAELAVRVPGADRALGAALASLDVIASNVPGPPVEAALAGVPVRAMTPVGPRSGAGLNATLLSYGDSASVGLNIDPAAFTDPGVLLDCLEAAFDEALAG
jgi:hypothetical protein